MSALQEWIQNHNRKLSQVAIDEALLEYIRHVEKQRDELLAALEAILPWIPTTSASEGGAARFSANVQAADKVRAAIASVKGGT